MPQSRRDYRFNACDNSVYSWDGARGMTAGSAGPSHIRGSAHLDHRESLWLTYTSYKHINTHKHTQASCLQTDAADYIQLPAHRGSHPTRGKPNQTDLKQSHTRHACSPDDSPCFSPKSWYPGLSLSPSLGCLSWQQFSISSAFQARLIQTYPPTV